MRADLLPAPDGAKVQKLLERYLEQRILSYTTHDSHQLEQVDSNTSKLQAEMWFTVKRAAEGNPSPPVTLAVSGMNDVLNRQGSHRLRGEPHSSCGMGPDDVSCDLLQPADWLSGTSTGRCSVYGDAFSGVSGILSD